MEAKIIKIGNSQGIIIPKALLIRIGIKDKVQIQEKDDGIFIKPIKKTREGWAESCKKLCDYKDEQLIFSFFENDFDKEEWTW